MPIPIQQKRWKIKLFAVCIAFIFASIVFGNSNRTLSNSLIISGCIFKAIIGIDCPACGIMRSVDSALQMDFYGSWILHPIGIPILIVIALYMTYFLLGLCTNYRVSIDWKVELGLFSIGNKLLVLFLTAIWIKRNY
jgi:hypothetical protein